MRPYNIGNDIVDLRAAGPQRHQNKRWLDKVFSSQEQGYIYAAEQPERQLWALWAAKESAYKVFLKQERKRQFRPKAIQLHAEEAGYEYRATYKDAQVGIHLETGPHYVHALSVALNDSRVDYQTEILYLPDCSLQAGRAQMHRRLLDGLQQGSWLEVMELQKCELGIPSLKGYEEHCDLSFSHHGAYYAYMVAFNPVNVSIPSQ